MSFFCHETSVIDEDVKIGRNSKIWHFCHISKGVSIEENVNIGQNVYIGENVKIGKNSKIQNNVSIFKNVTLEEDVFCGPSVVFTNVKNPRSFINRKNEFISTLIKKGATLGANSTIICGITINDYSLIGAGSVVTKDVKSFSCVFGVPAKIKGWVNLNGDKLPFPIKGTMDFYCKNTNLSYHLSKDKVTTSNVNKIGEY